ncbi:fatty acid synthase [Nephila pilipes]|uniref:Fatty acid synthase n=1 Tax=Nephila pilipes TaxID=299642 RepID=A0A8X6NUX9_NEPPI|nr:fatty acid synthase [Nephila pilipes]
MNRDFSLSLFEGSPPSLSDRSISSRSSSFFPLCPFFYIQGLKIFLNDISFHGVFLDQLFDLQPDVMETVEELCKLVKNGIGSGVVQPLDRKVFDRNSTEQALRYMSKGVHIGKILLKVRNR